MSAPNSDWRPRLRGAVYCSPGCGRGCTKAEHDRAVKSADKLARKLGAGWEADVWENLGWHYRALKGVAEVNPNIHRGKVYGYTVFFNSARQVVASAETAEDALGFAIQDARSIERSIAADCAELLA